MASLAISWSRPATNASSGSWYPTNAAIRRDARPHSFACCQRAWLIISSFALFFGKREWVVAVSTRLRIVLKPRRVTALFNVLISSPVRYSAELLTLMSVAIIAGSCSITPVRSSTELSGSDKICSIFEARCGMGGSPSTASSRDSSCSPVSLAACFLEVSGAELSGSDLPSISGLTSHDKSSR